MTLEKELPEGWVECSIVDVANINPKNQAEPETLSGFVPMSHAPTDFKKTLKFEEKPWGDIKKSYTNFRDGDVIFAKVTPCFENGKAAIVNGLPNGIGAGSSEFYVLRAITNEVLPELLFALIKTREFAQQGAANMTGAVGLRRVPRAFVGDYALPLPPLAEQRVIADKLDTLLAQVATTKTRLERVPETIKRFRQSVLAAAVSGKLTEEWRANLVLEPVQLETIDVEDREGIFSTLSPNQIPSTWRLHRLKEVGTFLGGGTPAKSEKDYWNGDIPWVTPKDMKIPEIKEAQLNISTKGLNNSSAKLIKSESILFVVRGMILAHSFPTAISKAELTINQDMKAIECFSVVNPSYLKHALDSQKGAIVGMAGSSTHGTKRLEAKHINNIPVPLPPLPEQQEIVRRVEELFAHADAVEQQAKAALEKVNNLTQSILAKAFRGELTADWRAANPELISGENSAEALLVRIREERAAQKPKKRATTRRKKKTA